MVAAQVRGACSVWETVEILTVAARFFSDQVVDIPVVSTTVAGVDVQKTVTVPQLQHI